MKNFMPNLSEKSVTSFTLPRLPHQHLRCSAPGGNIASFIFAGLSSWSEQGKLIGQALDMSCGEGCLID
jgi:hypothetical protein